MIAGRAAAYGIPGKAVDGQDVLAVYDTVSEAVTRARAGDGATLIESKTYRFGAHTAQGKEHNNRQFRGQNRTTDVLAFPDDDDGQEDSYLGDILICVETADRQRKKSLLKELQVLSLHGLLHLLGYDHHTDGGKMQTLERKLRREFQLH